MSNYSEEKISILASLDQPFSFYTIEAVLKSGIKVDSIIVDSKKYSEKNARIWNERTSGNLPMQNFSALELYGVPFFFFKSHNSDSVEAFIKKRDISVVVNAGTPRILKKNVLNAPKRGVINCHPGVLPKYRGCTVPEWSIYNDDQIGNTTHFMTEGIDEGPIISVERYNFSRSDSYSDIRTSLYKSGFLLMANSVRKVIEENMSLEFSEPQPKGQYWDVISEEKMQKVYLKINNGNYKYQS